MREMINEEDVKEFINRLPDLDNPAFPFEENIVHLVMTCVRTKKTKEMMNVKVRDTVLERKIIRKIHSGVGSLWKTRYFNSVFNLSLLQASGKYDFRETLIPSQAVGILATIAPRHVTAALLDLMDENLKLIIREPQSLELAKQHTRWFGRLHAHRAPGYNFVTLDIETLDPIVYKRIRDYATPLKVQMVTETSGGFHIVLNLCNGSDAEAFFHAKTGIQKEILEKESPLVVEILKDSQEPIPGTMYHRAGTDNFMIRIIE